jgi:hypothetical protein
MHPEPYKLRFQDKMKQLFEIDDHSKETEGGDTGTGAGAPDRAARSSTATAPASPQSPKARKAAKLDVDAALSKEASTRLPMKPTNVDAIPRTEVVNALHANAAPPVAIELVAGGCKEIGNPRDRKSPNEEEEDNDPF